MLYHTSKVENKSTLNALQNTELYIIENFCIENHGPFTYLHINFKTKIKFSTIVIKLITNTNLLVCFKSIISFYLRKNIHASLKIGQ